MSAENNFAMRTEGKRVLKPRPLPLASEIPGRSRLSGKGFAQLASTTRTAIESPYNLSRGSTDFDRTANRRIRGHSIVSTRIAQGRRDARNQPQQIG